MYKIGSTLIILSIAIFAIMIYIYHQHYKLNCSHNAVIRKHLDLEKKVMDIENNITELTKQTMSHHSNSNSGGCETESRVHKSDPCDSIKNTGFPIGKNKYLGKSASKYKGEDKDTPIYTISYESERFASDDSNDIKCDDICATDIEKILKDIKNDEYKQIINDTLSSPSCKRSTKDSSNKLFNNGAKKTTLVPSGIIVSEESKHKRQRDQRELSEERKLLSEEKRILSRERQILSNLVDGTFSKEADSASISIEPKISNKTNFRPSVAIMDKNNELASFTPSKSTFSDSESSKHANIFSDKSANINTNKKTATKRRASTHARTPTKTSNKTSDDSDSQKSFYEPMNTNYSSSLAENSLI